MGGLGFGFGFCVCMHTYNFYFLNSTVVRTLLAFSWNLHNLKFFTCHILLTLIVNSVAVSSDMQASTVHIPLLPKTRLIHSSFTKCHHQYSTCHIFDSLSNLSFHYSYLKAVTANMKLLLLKQSSFINLPIHLIKKRDHTPWVGFTKAPKLGSFSHSVA